MTTCRKCGQEIVRNGPFGWMHRVTQRPSHVIVAEVDHSFAARDASLGVGHIWTAAHCPAYSTLRPADCTCRAT